MAERKEERTNEWTKKAVKEKKAEGRKEGMYIERWSSGWSSVVLAGIQFIAFEWIPITETTNSVANSGSKNKRSDRWFCVEYFLYRGKGFTKKHRELKTNIQKRVIPAHISTLWVILSDALSEAARHWIAAANVQWIVWNEHSPLTDNRYRCTITFKYGILVSHDCLTTS